MRDRVCPPRRMRFSFESRCRLVALIVEGMSPQAAAAACGASRATGYRLWRRFREGGWAALVDRPPIPKRQPRRLSPELEQRILAAREYANAGPLIVAGQLGLPASTVWKVLRRHGRSRLSRPQHGPVHRYERSRPGELVHVDIKKLGRIIKPGHRVTGDRSLRAKGKAGWQYLFVAIDDHSRLGFASVLRDETADSALIFLEQLVSFYGAHGIRVQRLLTDNGSCFKRRWADACASRGIAVRKTRAYRPQTNGKAERFIRTLLERWAYAYTYEHETERLSALPSALDFYNRFRPHRALGGITPQQRVNNLPGTYN